MNELNFKEADKQTVIEFLNFVAKHARFDLNTDEVISYFKLLSGMQKEILPKIHANILEIKRVVEPQENEKPKRGRPRKS